MMLSRVWPRWQPGSFRVCCASGPRWRTDSVIRPIANGGTDRSLLGRMTAIPHIVGQKKSTEHTETQRAQREDKQRGSKKGNGRERVFTDRPHGLKPRAPGGPAGRTALHPVRTTPDIDDPAPFDFFSSSLL